MTSVMCDQLFCWVAVNLINTCPPSIGNVHSTQVLYSRYTSTVFTVHKYCIHGT